MYHPGIKREIPEFVTKYLAFSSCLIDAYKQKTCLVLTKNIKFFEFYQKQLVASIDLANTFLDSIKDALKAYDGPKSSVYGENNVTTESDICIGKYVFHTLNLTKVYIIVQCWDKCVILMRSPNFGFEVKAEYENVQGFRITHGTIKYCPVLELEFKNGSILRTDFEEDNATISEMSDFANKKNELKLLLDRVRSAKTELRLHESITAHSFERLQNRLTYGLPYVRSLKLEEKQMLARCGDIWKRVTPNNDLVIGVPLVNQCAPPNLTILHNIQPLLELDSSPETSVIMKYRLFQLKQAFYDLDSVETYLQSEDEQIQANVWSSDTKCQLLPESFMILVMQIPLSDIISLKQSPLLLYYEVLKDYHSSATTTTLQIFLEIIDFHEILYTHLSKYSLSFQPETLHQDFLTIAMSSQETNLQITFKHQNDLEVFECCLQQKFELEKLPFAEDSLHHLVFYNHLRHSLWFGCLCLRFSDIEDDVNDHSITSWKFYCPNGGNAMLFIKMLLNDLIALQCNVVSIRSTNKTLKNAQRVGEFENALRKELDSMKKLSEEEKTEDNFDKWSKIFMELGKAQMKSDVLFKEYQESDSKINTDI